MAIEPNDEELFAIDRLQRQVQAKYTGRPMDLKLIESMCKELQDGFFKLGFNVNVSIVSHGGVSCPEVTIMDRVDGELKDALAKETDHERRRFDALHHGGAADIKKLSPNAHLLD
jgi:hypothetical protein